MKLGESKVGPVPFTYRLACCLQSMANCIDEVAERWGFDVWAAPDLDCIKTFAGWGLGAWPLRITHKMDASTLNCSRTQLVIQDFTGSLAL